MRIRVAREVLVPDRIKLERYRQVPALGPRVLFFSGGTALRDTSAELVRYTHNSVHIITPFDSGGSSAILRKAFDMPAVGDIRNRLMALADTSL
ncbi:MAG: 2-phospho-L-lactate transferase CofD family protein, partial [Desulfovibrio sp.]